MWFLTRSDIISRNRHGNYTKKVTGTKPLKRSGRNIVTFTCFFSVA